MTTKRRPLYMTRSEYSLWQLRMLAGWGEAEVSARATAYTDDGVAVAVPYVGWVAPRLEVDERIASLGARDAGPVVVGR